MVVGFPILDLQDLTQGMTSNQTPLTTGLFTAKDNKFSTHNHTKTCFSSYSGCLASCLVILLTSSQTPENQIHMLVHSLKV